MQISVGTSYSEHTTATYSVSILVIGSDGLGVGVIGRGSLNCVLELVLKEKLACVCHIAALESVVRKKSAAMVSHQMDMSCTTIVVTREKSVESCNSFTVGDLNTTEKRVVLYSISIVPMMIAARLIIRDCSRRFRYRSRRGHRSIHQ